MICPKCGENCPEHSKFCGSCGTHLGTPAEAVEGDAEAVSMQTACVEPASAETAVPQEPSEPTGRIWPPLAIMGVLTALGLILFYLAG